MFNEISSYPLTLKRCFLPVLPVFTVNSKQSFLLLPGECTHWQPISRPPASYPYENNPILFLFYVYFNAILFGPCILLLLYCTSKIGPLFYLCFHLILILFFCKIYYERCILLLFFCTSWKIACKIVCFNPILQADGPKHLYFIAIFQNRLKNSMKNSLF